MILAWPLVMVFALSTYFGMANDPLSWLPEEAAEQQNYRRFRGWFGSDDVILVSWEGCSFEDSRLPSLANALVEHAETGRYVERVTSIGELVDPLTRPPHNLTRSAAIDRFRGILVAPRGTLGCLMLTMSQEADSHRVGALEAIGGMVSEHAGVDPSAVHMAGPFVYRTALDYESTRNLGWIAIAACSIGLALAWFFLRRFRLAGLTLCCGAFSGLCTVVLVGLTGGRMSPVMLVMPTLVFVLATSAGIHLVNYYRDALGEASGEEAIRLAVPRAWKPCWYAALTTAIGLASLGISQVRPVAAFGFYSAAGVIGSLFLVFGVLPGALERFPPRPIRPGMEREGERALKSRLRRRPFEWEGVGRMVSRRCWSIVLLGAAASCLSAIGLAQLTTSARVRDLFSGDTRIIRDYQWLENRFGPLDPVEAVVAFEDGATRPAAEQFTLVAELTSAIDGMAESGGTISAASFLPPYPSGSSLRQTARRAVFHRMLEQDRQALAETGYFHGGDGLAVWRIRTQVAALGELEYDRFISEVETTIAPILEEPRDAGRALPELEFTGLPVLTQAVQQRLLRDLFCSYLAAFLVISVVIGLMQKSVGLGVIAMVPNLFPAVTVFGIIGWLGQPVDIGAMVTASVALGIAVDDTLHFLTGYREGRQAGQPSGRAVTTAYRRSATAMVHTTLICGLALLPHAVSSCVPVSRFAWLMLTLLAAALVGDLLLLPAILLLRSRGRAFRGVSSPARQGAGSGTGAVVSTNG